MQIRRDDGNENGREAAQEELARHKNLRVQSRKEQFFGKALSLLLRRAPSFVAFILSDRFDWSVALANLITSVFHHHRPSMFWTMMYKRRVYEHTLSDFRHRWPAALLIDLFLYLKHRCDNNFFKSTARRDKLVDTF